MDNVDMSKQFYINYICRDDLLNAGLDEALTLQLTDEEMKSIAEEIGDAVDQMVGDLIAEIANERQQKAVEKKGDCSSTAEL